jgi:hypothetical protein
MGVKEALTAVAVDSRCGSVAKRDVFRCALWLGKDGGRLTAGEVILADGALRITRGLASGGLFARIGATSAF